MIQFIIEHYETIVTAITGILTGLIGIFIVIPGDQPEKALQAVVDFIKKISMKKLD